MRKLSSDQSTTVSPVSAITEMRDHVVERLQESGWAWIPNFQQEEDNGVKFLSLARMLGEIFLSQGMDPEQPWLKASANPNANAWEPFNQLTSIGWHNDFSTWKQRPRVSMAWLRGIPASTDARGDWCVVGCADVVRELDRSELGRRTLSLLETQPLPFCFARGEPVTWFRVIEARCPVRVRFYGRALRLGLALEPIEGGIDAVDVWEAAADQVGGQLVAAPGDLLVCDNWESMHDRLKQDVGRLSLLTFVARHSRCR